MTGNLKRWFFAAAMAFAGGVIAMPAQETAPRPEPRVVLVGDSTVADTAGWGPAFTKLLRAGVRCTNAAVGGASTKSFLDSGKWQAALELKPTYVLIQFGHNDMPGKGPQRATDAATTYRANLVRYIEEARAAGAKPIIVSAITRRNFKDGKLVDLLADYAAAAKAVAAQQKVPFVDLHARSIAAVERLGPQASEELGPLKDGKRDTTHLSAAGAEWAASLVAEELRTGAPELARLLK